MKKLIEEMTSLNGLTRADSVLTYCQQGFFKDFFRTAQPLPLRPPAPTPPILAASSPLDLPPSFPSQGGTPYIQLKGMGERCQLPSGPGRSVAAKRFYILVCLKLKNYQLTHMTQNQQTAAYLYHNWN